MFVVYSLKSVTNYGLAWICQFFRPLQFHELFSIFQFYFLAANAQALNINVSHHVLARSKAEILHLVELLIESNRGELVDLLVDVVDIILHCIDHNHLKSRSLSEVCMFWINMFNESINHFWKHEFEITVEYWLLKGPLASPILWALGHLAPTRRSHPFFPLKRAQKSKSENMSLIFHAPSIYDNLMMLHATFYRHWLKL